MKLIFRNHNFYSIVTIIFWSLAFLFTKNAVAEFTPYEAGFLRYLVASLALVVIVIVMKVKPPAKKDLPAFFVSGAIGFFAYMIFFNTATSMLNGGTCSVVIAAAPVITAIEASVLYKERLKLYQWIAFGISFTGVAVMLLLNRTSTGGVGILWAVGAAFVLATYNVWQRRLTAVYSGLQTAAYSIFIGTILLAVFSPSAFRTLPQASGKAVFALVFLGIFSSAIAYVSWSKAFELAKRTTDVSNYMFLTPFLTTLIGFAAAGERPDAATLIGGGMILAGVFLFQKDNFCNSSIRKNR